MQTVVLLLIILGKKPSLTVAKRAEIVAVRKVGLSECEISKMAQVTQKFFIKLSVNSAFLENIWI